MKFITKIILIAGLSYIAEQFFPWWSIMVCAFLINFILPTRGFSDFLSGFLGVGLLWILLAWAIDANTDSILTDKIAVLFEFQNSGTIVALTGLVGGISGGFAALTGSLLRNINRADPPKPGYYS